MFCKEIEQKLLNKEIDIAVHSLKDLDSLETKGLVIQAFIKRNDPRDAFVSKKKKNFLCHLLQSLDRAHEEGVTNKVVK